MGKWRTYRNRGSVGAPETPGTCTPVNPADYATTFDDVSFGTETTSLTDPSPAYSFWDIRWDIDGVPVGSQLDNPFGSAVSAGDSGWSGHHLSVMVKQKGPDCPDTAYTSVAEHDFP